MKEKIAICDIRTGHASLALAVALKNIPPSDVVVIEDTPNVPTEFILKSYDWEVLSADLYETITKPEPFWKGLPKYRKHK